MIADSIRHPKEDRNGRFGRLEVGSGGHAGGSFELSQMNILLAGFIGAVPASQPDEDGGRQDRENAENQECLVQAGDHCAGIGA